MNKDFNKMKIITYQNGPFSVNSYYLQDDQTVLIIDPGSEIELLLNDIIKLGIYPGAVLITHPHIDHIQGIQATKERFPNTTVYMSTNGRELIKEIPIQALLFGQPDPGKLIIDSFITSETAFTIGSISVIPISTPGHCPGSISYLIGSNLFSGDTLFKGTIGRSDVPGGDGKLLIESITKKLLLLPDNVVVYPGHGDPTTIDREKKSNPYLSRR
jgi:hydroxyacylglutathione hydrolase